jgi:hypothetical protein
VAIDTLKRIAMGTFGPIGADVDGLLGLAAGTLESKGFDDPPARVCALRSIGKTGLDDAVYFLSKLTQADFKEDPASGLWQSAQIALRDSQLRRISDPRMKIEFLEGILTSAPDGRGSVADWAVDELCDRGSQTSLPIISKSLLSRRNGRRDQDDVEFCEARIRVILSDSDRIKALSASLDLSGTATNTRIIGWAINELASTGSPAAEAQLDRFAQEIDHLPDGSPAKTALQTYRQGILNLQRQRAK